MIIAPLVREFRHRFAEFIQPCPRQRGNEDGLRAAFIVADDFRRMPRHVDLVVDQNGRHVVGLDVVKHGIHFRDLFFTHGRRSIHHVKQKVGMNRFVKRRLEGFNQLVRKPPDEAHRIGSDNRFLVVQPELSRRRVERGEKLVGGVGLCARQLIEERRLPGIGIARQRHRDRIASRSGAALRAALARKALQLIAKLLHPNADHAAVKFDLLFARTARFA